MGGSVVRNFDRDLVRIGALGAALCDCGHNIEVVTAGYDIIVLVGRCFEESSGKAFEWPPLSFSTINVVTHGGAGAVAPIESY